MWHCMEHLFSSSKSEDVLPETFVFTHSIGERFTNFFRLGFKNKIMDYNIFIPKTLVLSNKESINLRRAYYLHISFFLRSAAYLLNFGKYRQEAPDFYPALLALFYMQKVNLFFIIVIIVFFGLCFSFFLFCY